MYNCLVVDFIFLTFSKKKDFEVFENVASKKKNNSQVKFVGLLEN